MRQSQDTIHCNEDRQCLIEDDTKDCKDSHLTVKEKGRFIKVNVEFLNVLHLDSTGMQLFLGSADFLLFLNLNFTIQNLKNAIQNH